MMHSRIRRTAMVFSVVAVFMLFSTAASALTSTNKTWDGCTASWGYGYNTWFGYYQSAGASNDADCTELGVGVNSGSLERIDSTYPSSAIYTQYAQPSSYQLYLCGPTACKTFNA